MISERKFSQLFLFFILFIGTLCTYLPVDSREPYYHQRDWDDEVYRKSVTPPNETPGSFQTGRFRTGVLEETQHIGSQVGKIGSQIDKLATTNERARQWKQRVEEQRLEWEKQDRQWQEQSRERWKMAQEAIAKTLTNSFTSLSTMSREDIYNALTSTYAKYIALGISATLVANVANKYIQERLFQKPEPALAAADEPEEGKGFFGTITSWFKTPTPINLKDYMVIGSKVEKELNYIMKLTKNVKKNGGQYENVLLWGPPGTGKTLFAKLLAKSSGMKYKFIPGANVSQFLAKGTAVQELNQLFEWAAAQKNSGVILFFDECETFLGKREGMSPAAQDALLAFLGITGTPSDKFMIVAATNRPGVLDPAVLSRFGLPVEMPIPEQAEREAILTMHINNIFGKQTKGNVVNYDYLKDPANISTLAEKMAKKSGRSLQKAVNRMRQLALAYDKTAIDQEIIDEVLKGLENDERVAATGTAVIKE